jgi:hypothetical protein
MKYLLILIFLLFNACIPAAQNTQTFQKISASESRAQDKLDNINKKISDCENRERNYLRQLTLPQTKAYSNFKDTLVTLDQAKINLADLQMKEVFGNSLKGSFLNSVGKDLALELFKLGDDKKRVEGYYQDISNIKQNYIINYNEILK